MNNFNQPPETDIPLALANAEDPELLHADLSNTKDVNEAEEAAVKEKIISPVAQRFTREQLAFKYLAPPTKKRRAN